MKVSKLKFNIYITSLIINLVCIATPLLAASEENLTVRAAQSAPILSSKPDIEPLNWTIDQQPNVVAYQALEFIAAAKKHGLKPSDYHLATLQQTINDKPFNLDRFNHLLTEGLLQLISDLKTGRLDASTADPDWFIPQDTFDAAAFLQHAFLSKNLSNHLQLLIPASNDYQKLTAALTRYQQYQSQGGWQFIPKTPLLYPGDHHPNIPLIQSRLAIEDDYLALTHTLYSDHYDALMEQAVRRFQIQYGLKVDGIIGSQTLQTMNISAASRVQQIKINLERRRWLPEDLGSRYLLINTANYSLKAIEQGQAKLAMKIIVGRKSRQTPSFTSQITRMVFNPYWNVPPRLARLDLLPKQQQDPNYFSRQGIRVFSPIAEGKVQYEPLSINWQQYNRRQALPYRLRQDPGDHNALGQIKFLFPNRWRVYLHDTPHKSLFDDSSRAFSSGCIRVNNPIGLANFSIAKHQNQQMITDGINSKQNRGHKLTDPLTLFVVYFTVSVSDNQVLFSPDVYQRDLRMLKLMY